MANTTTPTIVTVNTTVTRAPTVSQLQQSGAVVSTGGTTLTSGHYQYCGRLSDVTSILAAGKAITSMAWATGTVTVTTAAPIPDLSTGDTFTTTIAGATPAAYNGTFKATVTGASTFIYALASNPGAETVPGTYTSPSSSFVLNAATTFFAQGNSVGMYVLELGAQATTAQAISALGTWLTDNGDPQVFYAYLAPYWWDSEAEDLDALAANYASPSGQTYFFVTTSSSNIATYGPNKSVFALVPSPTAAIGEIQAAQAFYQWLVNKPGPAAQLAPMAFRYGFGVTPWVQMGNAATINTVLSAYGNLILTGAEGGISTATLFKGTTMDGEQSAWWYGVDWFRIQVKQALAAAVINGSNSNPRLLYNQAGINTLLAVAQNVGNSAVSFGCALSVVVDAVPFQDYVTQNPNDYNAGIYKGFSATLVGQNGFLTITFNLDATQFAS